MTGAAPHTRRAALAGVLPFAAATACAFATLPLPPRTSDPGRVEALVAGLIAALALGLGYLARRRGAGPWLRAAPPYLFLVAVAVLRDAEGGAQSGFGILVLLTLTSLAMNTDRAQLLVGIALMAAMFVAPILLVGAPEYPPAEWRRALLWVIVGGLTARTMQGLVGRVRQQADDADELSRIDALTGLANRRLLFEFLERELATAHRTSRPLVVAMIDLDHFKRFNDERGHAEGDRLLRETAEAWGAVVRPSDLLARYGGEEFTLVLPEIELSAAQAIAERLRAAVPDHQTCSIGVAQWDGAEPAEQFISRADAALYEAKRAGRDRVVPAAPTG